MGLKLAGYLIAFALIVGSYYYAFDKGGDLREAEIKVKISKSNADAAAKEKKDAANAAKKLSQSTDYILHSGPDEDGPIAPVLRNQLNRMQLH